MVDVKPISDLGTIARQMAADVLRAEHSQTKGQYEMAWLYLGVLFISNSIGLAALHPEEKGENRYYQDTAIAASKRPKEIARRLLEQAMHIDEVLKNASPEQMQKDVVRFIMEVQEVYKREKERGGK